MTASNLVTEVAMIWLVGWKVPFSATLGLMSAYVWVVPWYLDDPGSVFAIRRKTRWGNALSIFVNAFLGYLLWPLTFGCFIWMVAKATLYWHCHNINLKTAFWAIFDNREETLPIPSSPTVP